MALPLKHQKLSAQKQNCFSTKNVGEINPLAAEIGS
jgi:hypothetical protein